MSSTINKQGFSDFIMKASEKDKEIIAKAIISYGDAYLKRNSRELELAHENTMKCIKQLEEKYQVKLMESTDGQYHEALIALDNVLTDTLAEMLEEQEPAFQNNASQKRMFCMYCGKEINVNSRFCSHCGKMLEEKQKPAQKETKVFHSGMALNNKTLKTINEWLQTQSIEIDSIAINARSTSLFVLHEMTLSRVELTYHRVQTQQRYAMGAFSRMALPGVGFRRVESDFEQWKLNNPSKRVVWKHCSAGDSGHTLFFLYQ